MIKEERRRKRRRKRRLIAFLVFLLMLAIAALVVIKVFTVEHVQVEGNMLYDDDTISATILNDEYSWNTLYVYLKYRFTKVEEIPFIDTMSISLVNPNTLHVTVYEKGLLGYLFDSGIEQNVYFDKDGFVVETSSEIIEGIPEIKGLSCDEVVLYEKLPIAKGVRKELLVLTQALKRNNLIPDSISYDTEESPVLTYEKVRIQIGSIDLLTKKVERIAKILPKLEGECGVLHLENWSEENSSIVFEKDE